jgi:hypothetical protein
LLSDRQYTTVYDHPAFIPHAVPPAPRLQFPGGQPLPGLGEVLFLPLEELATLPLGYLNLLCATLLPDTADLNIPACMRTLSAWTQRVHRETDRQLWKFRQRPGDFENSEAYFRVLVMITVLQRDCGVTYDRNCVNVKTFATAREGFIHGLLSGDKKGTCANMPVLYAAAGRALGYPIYLAAAKGHVFCRWQNARTGERFNIEASGHGVTTPPDAHYAHWPRPITEAEVRHGIFLRNLDPAEELAHFMATRGHCLLDRGHVLDAIVAYGHAHRLAPTDPTCMSFLLAAINREIDLRAEGKLPCSYREAEVFNRTDCPPLARYVIDVRYNTRAGGVNPAADIQGRVISHD